MEANAELIRSVVADVLTRIGNNSGAATAAPAPTSAPQRAAASYGKRPGVFENPDDAIQATGDAVQRLRSKGYAGRREVVRIVKELCTAKAEEWGKLEFAETKIGRLEHKIAKLQGIQAIPGVEWLSPLGMSGDHGISLEENAPFGVIAAMIFTRLMIALCSLLGGLSTSCNTPSIRYRTLNVFSIGSR